MRKKRRIASALLEKAFTERSGKSDHRVFLYLVEGKKTGISTRMSHSSQTDVSRQLVSAMAQQCRLSKDEFLDLVDCPMSPADYHTYLKGLQVTVIGSSTAIARCSWTLRGGRDL